MDPMGNWKSFKFSQEQHSFILCKIRMLSDFENLCKPGTWFILYFRGFNPPKEGPFPFIKQGYLASKKWYVLMSLLPLVKIAVVDFYPADLPVHLLRRCWNRERLQLHYRSAGLGRSPESFFDGMKKSPCPSKREAYIHLPWSFWCVSLMVMLVFFSIFFVREILHTSHVKSHIGSNRKKGNQHGCHHFSKKCH